MKTKQALRCYLCLLFAAMMPLQSSSAKAPTRLHSLQVQVPNPTLTSEWAGVWEITITRYECENATPDSVYTKIDTLCTGDRFPYPVWLLYCNGTIDATSIDVGCFDCTELRCVYEGASSVTATRSGDTFSGTGSYEFSSSCPWGQSDGCYEYEYGGTRIEPGSVCTVEVPVRHTTWGQIKARYP